jgi:hypothetical protein
MKSSIRNFILNLDTSKVNTNSKRALYRLLIASDEVKDGWTHLSDFDLDDPGHAIRDLRRERFGSFDIICKNGKQINLDNPKSNGHYYRLVQKDLTVQKIKKTFGL